MLFSLISLNSLYSLLPGIVFDTCEEYGQKKTTTQKNLRGRIYYGYGISDSI